MFFAYQQEVIENCVVGNWNLQMPFTWFIQQFVGSQLSYPTPNAIDDSFVHPQQREIYVGQRMTKAVECRWQGNLQELKVGMLIATPVDNDHLGHQFWIAKVVDVVMHESISLIKSIKVH